MIAVTSDPDAHLRAPRLSPRAKMILVVVRIVYSAAVAWLGVASASAGSGAQGEPASEVASLGFDDLP